MSVKLIGRVFELAIPVHEKLLLLAMADRCGEDGKGAYESVRTTAKKSSMSRRSVQRLLRRLEKAHFIRRVGKSKYGTTEYQLTLGMGTADKLSGGGDTVSPPPATREARTRDTGGAMGATLRPPAPDTVSPDPSLSVKKSKIVSGCRSLWSSQDTKGTPSETLEKAERQFPANLERTAKSKSFPGASWLPKDPLRAEFRRGIYADQVEKVFFDSRLLTFPEQLRDCLANALTQLFTGRTGKMMRLSESEVETLALERMSGSTDSLELIADFDTRCHHTARCVVSAAVEAAAACYEKKFPPAPTQGGLFRDGEERISPRAPGSDERRLRIRRRRHVR